MIFLVPIFIIIITYMTGELITWAFRDSKKSTCEKCLIGTFGLLIIWELMTVIAIKRDIAFALLCRAYTIVIALIVVLSVLSSIKKMVSGGFFADPLSKSFVISITTIIVLQIVAIAFIMPDNSRDYTVETVSTTLYTDSVYKFNPITGNEFVTDMSFRGKLVSLPLFYAYLVSLFDCDISLLVYKSITVWSILLNAMCYYLWGMALFKDSEKRQMKMAFFVVGTGILNISGLFSSNSIFYYQIMRGFRGETLCFGVVIPYCLYAFYNIASVKSKKTIVYLLMAIVSTIALIDIYKGLVPCIIAMLICVGIMAGYRIRRTILCRRS